MKNKNIKDTFESFSPSEERKDKIYNSIVNSAMSKDKGIASRSKAGFAYSLAACVILAATAVILITGQTGNSNISALESDNPQYNQTSIPSDNKLPGEADKQTAFKGFVLTAYAANSETLSLSANYINETENIALEPDVKILLAQYTPTMSSVPGLPFTVDIAQNDKDSSYIEAINVYADSGELLRWDRNTGVISHGGQSTVIDSGETIYWSPLYSHDPDDMGVITISVEAVSGGAVIGRQSIFITRDNKGYYYATAGELELV